MSDSKRTRRAARLEREDAYRVRAGAIGILQSCVCDFPLRQHATASRHDELCPSHYLTKLALERGDHYAIAMVRSGKTTP